VTGNEFLAVFGERFPHLSHVKLASYSRIL
jgi:hypothetical protein